MIGVRRLGSEDWGQSKNWEAGRNQGNEEANFYSDPNLHNLLIFTLTPISTPISFTLTPISGLAGAVYASRQNMAILAAVSRLISGQALAKISIPWVVPITCRQRAGTPAFNKLR